VDHCHQSTMPATVPLNSTAMRGTLPRGVRAAEDAYSIEPPQKRPGYPKWRARGPHEPPPRPTLLPSRGPRDPACSTAESFTPNDVEREITHFSDRTWLGHGLRAWAREQHRQWPRARVNPAIQVEEDVFIPRAHKIDRIVQQHMPRPQLQHPSPQPSPPQPPPPQPKRPAAAIHLPATQSSVDRLATIHRRMGVESSPLAATSHQGRWLDSSNALTAKEWRNFGEEPPGTVGPALRGALRPTVV